MRSPELRASFDLLPGEPGRDRGRFVRGHRHSVRTEFAPGERRSVTTEFQLGQSAHNRLPVGTVTIRREANTGLNRAWVKVAEPNVWQKRAVVVWEAENGPLPSGMVIHHKDRNSLNDDITNLVALTRKEHVAEHRHEIEVARKAAS